MKISDNPQFRKSSAVCRATNNWSAKLSLHKNWNTPLRIFSVSVIKSVGMCEFGHIYWRNPWWKTSFFMQSFTIFFSYQCKLLQDTSGWLPMSEITVLPLTHVTVAVILSSVKITVTRWFRIDTVLDLFYYFLTYLRM